jgi:hypothetical protein
MASEHQSISSQPTTITWDDEYATLTHEMAQVSMLTMMKWRSADYDRAIGRWNELAIRAPQHTGIRDAIAQLKSMKAAATSAAVSAPAAEVVSSGPSLSQLSSKSIERYQY